MPTAYIAIIILVVCVFLFITKWVNTCVAAAIGCVAFILTGICTFADAFSGFSNSTVILVFSALLVGEAMRETGADVLVGRFVVRISKDNERLFIFAAGLVSGLMSMWMANTAVVATFLPIIWGVARQSKHMTMKNMTMSITFGAMFGGSCTLVGSTSQLVAQGLMQEMTDTQFELFTFMPVGIIILVAYLAYEQLIGYKLGLKLWGNRQLEGIRSEEIGDIDDKQADKKKIIILLVIFVLMLLSYIFAWLPTALTALCTALVCFLTRCADPKKAMRNLDWNCVFFMACCMGIANGLNKSGAIELIANGLFGMLGNDVNPLLFFAIVVVITFVVSNFIANATTTIIFLPIVISACYAYGFNVLPFGIGVVYAANLTCGTPFAHAQITMTMVAGYRFTDYVKANMPLQLLTVLLIVGLVPLFFPLVG